MNPVRWYHRPEFELTLILALLALCAWLWRDRI